MANLKNTKTAAKDIAGAMEETELSSAKTILEIDERMSWNVDGKKKNRFAFFVKSPVNQTFTVDWGDGAVCQHNGSDKRILLSYNYSSAKKYVVTIQGVITTLVEYYNVWGGIRKNPFYIETCDMRSNPYIEALSCHGNLLLHNNYSLKELERFAVGIDGIDLTQLPALECIEFMDSLYKGTLDFSHNPKLKYLRCPCNEDISALDVSHCPDLEFIDICYAGCRLDLENNHKLKYLFANGIKKEHIRLPKGRTVIMDHDYKVPEKYWPLLGEIADYG